MTNTDFVWSRQEQQAGRQAGGGLEGQEQTGRQEQAWSKLGTRLDLMPLPMMEA